MKKFLARRKNVNGPFLDSRYKKIKNVGSSLGDIRTKRNVL
ncbi:hypothetical protein LEP1GSC103_1451 [Leptospira borgpetersenii serovar Javanica str. UI 09931]|uniref:Uncharacterized protein n=4 Tax=Leptospira borgpetersenii TaxID=174 RepID=A0A0S2IQN0_LEPBO|nr:hypothetical protein LBBP_01677 [Leptospira borgpetersenii serovar Ballum]EKP11930.1 hypothetical protein LEP1GSC128_0352 [Leptospira borgpetersenii str. 200801926]EKQ90403.1 hypothetical protein LEP1GSC101_2347 [Leptospira borgpetersenii str. UI 09149]EKR00668.1 hypothetical protein LEP1GSC121_1092 [Leptospira borgpetersenii serovar Castellonis str. 200801910]EMK08784.1 hypothetical protein LEP1GSC066_4070 [Leptospira sp. serovar Kenya str. Sh9]EMN13151.1 hypothetical protein LEP1GSC055_30